MAGPDPGPGSCAYPPYAGKPAAWAASSYQWHAVPTQSEPLPVPGDLYQYNAQALAAGAWLDPASLPGACACRGQSTGQAGAAIVISPGSLAAGVPNLQELAPGAHLIITAKIKARAADDEQQARETADSETLHDANPWLRMTRWARYLAGVHFPDLIDVVTPPDPDDADPASQATQRVWDAMIWLACQPLSQLTGLLMGQLMGLPDGLGGPAEPADRADGLSARWSPDPMAPDLDPRRIEPFVMTPLETTCLEFCIELLNQKIKVHEYESPLVCAMAVLGRGEQGWRDTDSYPPIISRVLKVARFLVVQKALWLDPEHWEIIRMWVAASEQGAWAGEAADQELGWLMEDEGYASAPSPPSSNETPSSPPQGRAITRMPRSQLLFQAGVDWMVQKFMVRGQHGPVEVLLDWRTFGLKIHYNTTTPGHVTWMGQERLLYKEMDFTMGHLLCQPNQEQWPPIPWHQLFDNPTKGTPGWSFLQDPRTPWPVTGGTWLVDRIAGEPAVARAFTTQGAVSPTKLQKYFQQVARFKEKLALAMHLTGGAPVRAPELLSIQHVNTKNNWQRNIFIKDGMVVEVGELVVWYLWLVLLFVRQLAVTWGQIRPSNPRPSPRASNPNPSSSSPSNPQPSNARPSNPRARNPAPSPPHRSPYVWGPDVGTGREWPSERLREVLKRESEASIGAQHALNITNYQDIAVGISRQFLRPSSIFPNNIQAEQEQEMAAMEVDKEESIGNIADKQAGHTPHVAGMVYGRESTEFAGSTTTRRLRFWDIDKLSSVSSGCGAEPKFI
ncbi:predicted protein [Aspergillus nidulans FGSC A4]|uniref:Uncharacterized protein n=1 Tax=Emericella nidulans (strain FGSC A4 / ATCC 38163 / CBS 112.46 / NRRL 194 / M139) TaxID=227321 RepID=Q5B2I2_EMENI|nr:hypothetical protein [Aspergillus nidulans FGSC A4]EAA62198.1 predicted protein [Aspergillus nidulans FGSC A4]CBF82248.1 TPA: hypothetical protein ANIA_05248 [Aspergillus nidulans FGSC A4]|eukprot:XP_662852.1 predicted protein [Aspergillus nidulans FGSC A4]